MTLLIKAWKTLRDDGPLSPRGVAARLGISTGRASNILRALAERGSVTATGNTHRRVYSATPKVPRDLRGKMPGTLENLKRGRALGLLEIARRRGRLLVPRPKDPLDLAMRKLRPPSQNA